MVEITNFDKFQKFLQDSQNILIIFDSQYSLDDLAAGLALGMSLEKLEKKVIFFSEKPPIVEQASLFGISKIVSRLDFGKVVISIPDALTAVDKVTHYLDGDVLNIVVHPVPNSERLQTEKIAIKKFNHVSDLAILINTSWTKFLSKFSTQEQNYYSEISKVVIGNVSEDFKDLIVVNSEEKICLSEMVVWLLTKLTLAIDQDCASNLFQGMKFATKFEPPQALTSTFEAAAICLAKRPTLPGFKLEDFSKVDTSFAKTSSFPQTSTTSTQIDLSTSDSLKSEQIEENAGNSSQVGQSLPDLAKVQSDWLGPKIFKSGSIKPKKT